MSGFRTFNPRGLTNSGDVARPERSEKAASSRTSTNIETVGRVLPAGACDCHAHVYGPFDQFPLPSAAPFQPPPASIQALEKLWESFGIERGVIVQGSAYRQDHRALLGATPSRSSGPTRRCAGGIGHVRCGNRPAACKRSPRRQNEFSPAPQ